MDASALLPSFFGICPWSKDAALAPGQAHQPALPFELAVSCKGDYCFIPYQRRHLPAWTGDPNPL